MRTDLPERQGFKSCPRVGGIPPPLRKAIAIDFVSSRAPVWGASEMYANVLFAAKVFQVVPPCGGHRMIFRPGASTGKFQVVPPCGGHQVLNCR